MAAVAVDIWGGMVSPSRLWCPLWVDCVAQYAYLCLRWIVTLQGHQAKVILGDVDVNNNGLANVE
jgi:hypothetical protein